MHEAATAQKRPRQRRGLLSRVAGALSELTRRLKADEPKQPAPGSGRSENLLVVAVGIVRLPTPGNLRTCVPSRIRQPSPVLRVPCRRQRSWWQCRRGDEGRSCKGSSLPHAFSKAWITSRTEEPVPVPRLKMATPVRVPSSVLAPSMEPRPMALPVPTLPPMKSRAFT